MVDISSETLLITANGKSVLDNELGLQIDKFEIVGRINNYETEGFEKYIGSKTNIWFNGANQGLKKRKDIPDRIVVLIPFDILQRKGDAIHTRISGRLGVERGKYELVPRSDMIEYERLIGAERPTTGTSSILWGIKHFDQVVIHGFDFFVDSKSHYNDNLLTGWLVEKGIFAKAGKHDMQREKQYIEMLIDEGKVIRLKDYLQ